MRRMTIRDGEKTDLILDTMGKLTGFATCPPGGTEVVRAELSLAALRCVKAFVDARIAELEDNGSVPCA
jgi:hypothetical protein